MTPHGTGVGGGERCAPSTRPPQPLRMPAPPGGGPAGGAGERRGPTPAPPLPVGAAAAKSLPVSWAPRTLLSPHCCCRFSKMTSHVACTHRVQVATYLLSTTGRCSQSRTGCTRSAVCFTVGFRSSWSGARFTPGSAFPRTLPHPGLGQPCSSGGTAHFTGEGTEVHTALLVGPGTS